MLDGKKNFEREPKFLYVYITKGYKTRRNISEKIAPFSNRK
jgi:hypothetical protein